MAKGEVTTANKIKWNQPKLQCCVLSKLALVRTVHGFDHLAVKI